jgi:hypothetical protein
VVVLVPYVYWQGQLAPLGFDGGSNFAARASWSSFCRRLSLLVSSSVERAQGERRPAKVLSRESQQKLPANFEAGRAEYGSESRCL